MLQLSPGILPACGNCLLERSCLPRAQISPRVCSDRFCLQGTRYFHSSMPEKPDVSIIDDVSSDESSTSRSCSAGVTCPLLAELPFFGPATSASEM